MTWRPMREADMDAVTAISDDVHGDYTEPRAVYDERRALFPSGCFVFERGQGVEGYLITHPWRHGGPPPLGALMGPLPQGADCLYLHDLALLPSARGSGAGARAAAMVLAIAAEHDLRDIYLLAVNGAETFWTSRGYASVTDKALIAYLRKIYGDVVYMHQRVEAAS
ncbi:GNAT family N-acetyltransferase [Novosphingobium rosa]|uniref:GNAT family N-acetyltransferase n=1 Tax=Novosphingobium rosa TaxID=76978 RepID=UPI00082C0C58|nr:GNAT family N-acetyltransferase [Novosphingobium rosa]